MHIYIPIWLDLLFKRIRKTKQRRNIFTFQYGQIYYLQVAFLSDLKSENLHSNMVRFIIRKLIVLVLISPHLHSNMVRFIIKQMEENNARRKRFTFQYGQIYYTLQVLFLVLSVFDLHSNMVRFIIFTRNKSSPFHEPFTFQYGQIYY